MEFVDKIKDVSRSVAARSGEFAESSKLTFAIKKKEREIRAIEHEMGVLVYQLYKNGHSFDEELLSECRRIDEISQEAVRLEQEKEKLGLDDLEVEVVESDIPDDDEVVLSEEDRELLRELDGQGAMAEDTNI